MNNLPPIPSHVLSPTADQMRLARAILDADPDLGRFSKARCRTCHGEGSFLMWSGKSGESDVIQFECPCKDQLILQRWMSLKGLRSKSMRLTIGDAEHMRGDDRWSTLSTWINDGPRLAQQGAGATFVGPPSSGKSLAATLIQKSMLRQGISAVHVDSRSLGQGGQVDWFSDDARHFWSDVKRADFVILDDLGREYRSSAGSPIVVHRVEDLVHFRIENGLGTIITLQPNVLDKVGSLYGSYVEEAVRDHYPKVSFVTPETRRFDKGSLKADEDQRGISRPIVFGKVA